MVKRDEETTVAELTQKPAAEVLRDTDRVSVGVVRILSAAAGTPGEEREYQTGDEAIVEAGQAEWVVAPVHSPAAGRRLDTDAEREQTPLGGVEVYPPAEPTTAARRSAARIDGSVEAHSDTGVGEQLAAKRAEVARDAVPREGDVKLQAELGGRAARSGPASAQSDLPADKPVEEAPPADSPAVKPAKAAPAKATPARDSGRE